MSRVLEEALVICSSGRIAEDWLDAFFGTPTMVLRGNLSSAVYAVYAIIVAECFNLATQ